MSDQLELTDQTAVKDPALAPHEDEKHDKDLAGKMIAMLAGHKCWLTRKFFHERIGWDRQGSKCRAARRSANGRVIAGQKGYKLLKYTDLDERREWRSFLMGQKRAAEKDIKDLDIAERTIEHGHKGRN